MLSLHKCREILGPAWSLTDAQLERLRDGLTGLADVALGLLSARLQNGIRGGFDAALTLIPAADRDEITERAAILEVDGGMDQSQAENEALRIWQEKPVLGQGGLAAGPARAEEARPKPSLLNTRAHRATHRKKRRRPKGSRGDDQHSN
jgi:hypothetical protein